MFWGEFSHHLDTKGRLIVPARFRPQLDDGAILTRGLDCNLVIFPPEAWQTVTNQLNQLPITHAKGRALRRLLFSGAVELACDRQGRILIPNYLRTYAGLDNQALLVGMETFIEIWEPSKWRTTLDSVSNVLEDSSDWLSLTL
ncbi:division/cell wall cluster transcriptional repressor MraZ [Phototrophicus methaneseepsis]|uniref:Transcriptional regulator MraZ n=1 Tax=Phototrophicus methaneseepsis TaxID=2710758 RepID=A0A7S8E7T7_9CHLR|nr:division/cell wall cluster transcriptional repressor MraZ [Phototrophicus methaneseepsis]QPC81934.1 division/cell wall cluster transcriptional repressor MraZ [Phototrophicus methaneseepsis]